MMNANGFVGGGGGGLFYFLKYNIGEDGVGLVLFFNKKLVTIVLEFQLRNEWWEISRGSRVEVNVTIRGV